MDSIWKEIKNFRELQTCMVEYLRSKYTSNPWCCSGIDTETIPIVSSLVKINSLGFVTVVSQPGVTTIWADCSAEYQRGFMTGFICKQKCDMFMDQLLKIPGIIICKTILGSGKPPMLYGIYESVIMNRPLKKEIDGSISRGTGKYINLTKEIIPESDKWLGQISEHERESLVKQGDKFIRYYTNKWVDYDCDETDSLIGVNETLLKYLKENTYQLTVIRSDYGSADLDSIILDILTELN